MAWSVCARLQQMQRLQHAANLACMHACMVHKIFLGMSQETMIKILTSPNPNILSCTIFSSSPATLEIWERKIQSFLTLSMRVCLCVCTLYRHAEVRPGQDTAAACSTRQSEIHIYSMVYSYATFQSANLQAAKQYLATKCMYQWLYMLKGSWLGYHHEGVCLWYICFKKVSQIKEMCHLKRGASVFWNWWMDWSPHTDTLSNPGKTCHSYHSQLYKLESRFVCIYMYTPVHCYIYFKNKMFADHQLLVVNLWENKDLRNWC
jgi:hypothetical protein